MTIARPSPTAAGDGPSGSPRRGRGERGTALVTALVLLFALTSGAVVWLSRDVNRRVTNRSAAQSIAFQAARAGAQRVEVGGLRAGGPGEVRIDEAAARAAAIDVAGELFDAFDVDGAVTGAAVGSTPSSFVVTVVIHDPVGDQTATGVARAEPGP